MTRTTFFSLTVDQVPDVLQGPQEWMHVLRWTVCVMDHDDSRLPFICGCLAHVLQHGALSEKQKAVCNKVIGKVIEDHQAGLLLCQCLPSLPKTAEDDEDFNGVIN